MKIRFLLLVGVFSFLNPLIVFANPYLSPQKTIIANGATSTSEGKNGVEFLSYRKQVSKGVIDEAVMEVARLPKVPVMLDLCNQYKLQMQNFYTAKSSPVELALQDYGGLNNVVSCTFSLRASGMPTKAVLTSEIQGKKFYQVYISE
jgi:hypothetical protein